MTLDEHCVKSVRIRSFSGPYFPVFSPNARKYGQEKLRIRTLFMQWKLNNAFRRLIDEFIDQKFQLKPLTKEK